MPVGPLAPVGGETTLHHARGLRARRGLGGHPEGSCRPTALSPAPGPPVASLPRTPVSAKAALPWAQLRPPAWRVQGPGPPSSHLHYPLHQPSAATSSNHPGSICLGLCTAGEALRSCTHARARHIPAYRPTGHQRPAQLQGSRGSREPGGLQLLDGEPGYRPTVPQDSQLCLPPPTIPVLSPTKQREVRNLSLWGHWGSVE